MTDAVAIGWIFPGTVSGWFTHSLVDLIDHDAHGPQRLSQHNGGGWLCLQSGPRVAEARTQIVDTFARQYPDADWLFMVDTDMTFEPDILERLIASADPVERPIMGALAFIAGGDNSGPRPTIYGSIPVEDGGFLIDIVRDYPKDAVCKVTGTGAAGLLVHRNVFARMKEPYPKGFGTLQNGAPNPYPWFAEGLVDSYGHPMGEDVAFCHKANALGIPVHVNTSVKMGHIKSYRLDEEYFNNHKDDEPEVHFDRSKPVKADPPPPENRAERRAAARQKVKS